MKRLLLLIPLLFIFSFSADSQRALKNVFTLADITGTGAAVQVCSSCGSAKWIQITTLSTNTSVVRFGDSNVTASRGAAIAPGGGQKLPNEDGPFYLPNLYVYIATNDKVTVTYGD